MFGNAIALTLANGFYDSLSCNTWHSLGSEAQNHHHNNKCTSLINKKKHLQNMGFNSFLKSLFGDKSTRDMKLIQPIVEKIKAAYPEIKALDNDALRAKTKEIQKYVQDSAIEQKKQIEELKAKIEDTPIDERETIFNQIDKLEKEVLDLYEKALNEVMPVAFSIIKDTARRFAENNEVVVTANDFDRELATTKDFVRIEGDKAIYSNHWIAGGNDMKWDMVHYDVQLFGGVVLHQGKIAEMVRRLWPPFLYSSTP